MKAFAKTDVGKVRENNQDYYAIANPEEEIQLFIVADGMGGYNGGEVASQLAVISVQEYFHEHWKSKKLAEDGWMEKLLEQAIEYANTKVYKKAKEQKELKGMGTTLEVCVIYNNKVYIGHVGDSSVYRIRKQFIRKLTTDHSYVQQLVKDGTITKEDAKKHPKKNMITKALGCEKTVKPDILVKGFLKDDILLMNTDGLTNIVEEKQIYDIIQSAPEEAADKLVEKANEFGGYDNITAVIIIK